MISKEEVKHIAELARIGLTEEEIGRFSHDLSSILDWMELLKEVDVTDVEPIGHITGTVNRKRTDKILEFSEKDKIVELFPEKKDKYDKVKSVL